MSWLMDVTVSETSGKWNGHSNRVHGQLTDALKLLHDRQPSEYQVWRDQKLDLRRHDFTIKRHLMVLPSARAMTMNI
jgi:hypothetical protein